MYLNLTTGSVDGEALIIQSLSIYERTEKKINDWRYQYAWTIGPGYINVIQVLIKAGINFNNDVLRERTEQIYRRFYSQEKDARRQAELTKKYLAEWNKEDRIPKQGWLIY